MGAPRRGSGPGAARPAGAVPLDARSVLIIQPADGSNGPMTKTLLLTVCALLVVFGIFTIASSAGFFVQLLGAIAMASGGSAAYLIQRPA